MWMTGRIPATTVYSAAVPPHTCHRLPPAVTQPTRHPSTSTEARIDPCLQYKSSSAAPRLSPVPLQPVLHHKLARLRLQRKFMARGGSFQAALPSFPHTAVAAPPQPASWRGNSGSGEHRAGTTEQPHVT